MTPARPFSMETLRALPRIALLAVALFAPLAAMQAVEAGQRATIEDSRAVSNGAGFVLLMSLRRS